MLLVFKFTLKPVFESLGIEQNMGDSVVTINHSIILHTYRLPLSCPE